MPAELHARAPDGSFYVIPSSKAGEALSKNWKIETPEETAARQLADQEGALGSVKAFGENLGSTATLGLSDVALGETLGNDYRKNRALREMAHPGASMAGEIGGMVLPALLTGGGSLLEEGAAEGGSALARAAGGTAKALGEWSPAGLALRGGEAASELVGHGLGRLGLTGESLVGKMALTGGRMAAGGAVEGALFGAGNALSEAALAPDGDYDKLAQKLWAGGIHGAEFGALVGGGLGAGSELVGHVARKIGGTFSARQMLEDFADSKALKSAGYQGSDIQKLTPEARSKLADAIRGEENIGWLDSLGDRAKKLKTAKQETGELLGTMRKQLDEVAAPGVRPNVRQVLEDADTRVTDMMLKAQTVEEEKAALKISKQLDKMRKSLGKEELSFEQTHELRRKIDDGLTNYGKKTYPASSMNRPPDLYEQGMMRVRTDMEREFERAADEAMAGSTPEFKAAYQDAKDRYGSLKEISKVANKRAGSIAGNRDVSLTDTIMAAGGFMSMGPKGLLLAAANRIARSTTADHVVGRLASDLARLDRTVTDSMNRFVNTSRRAREGIAAAVEVPHNVGSKQILKEVLHHGKEVSKTGVSSTLHVRAEAHEKGEKVREYYEKLGHIEREAASPPGTMVHIPGAPQIEQAAERTRRGAIQYLLSQAPKAPARINHPMLARIARQTEPDPVAVMKWMRKVETVENPMSVLKAMESRRLTTDHVDALKATAPAVLEMFRRAALAKITDEDSDMAYEDRIQLGTLLGVETDPSLRPESIQLSQSVYAARPTPAQPMQPTPSAPPQKARRYSSRADELEANSTVE